MDLTLTDEERYALNNALGARISELESTIDRAEAGDIPWSRDMGASWILQLQGCRTILERTHYTDEEILNG